MTHPHVWLLPLILFCSTPALASLPRSSVEPGLEQRWQAFLNTPKERTPGRAFPFAHCFERAARIHDLPETLLLAVARGESAFDPRAHSTADAYGLMQIRWPGTAKDLGITRLERLLDPCSNVEAGARYLKRLLKRYRGNLHLALAGYNYGPSRIPVHGGTLPRGAVWYSGYILRHLQYVLGSDRPAADQGRWLIIRFSRPYRARALVESLQPKVEGIRLDWFRRPRGGFDVMLVYDTIEELERGRRLLSDLGFE